MISEFFLIIHQRTIVKYQCEICPNRPGWLLGYSPELIWGDLDDVDDFIETNKDESNFFLTEEQAMLVLLETHQSEVIFLTERKNYHIEEVRKLVKNIYGVPQEE